MLTRTELEDAQAGAAAALAAAGIVLTAAEQRGIEVADFGLSDLEHYGLELVTYVNTERVCAKELVRYGVRSNAIAPGARTRLTLETPGLGDAVKPPDDPGAFDLWDPANVSPFVAYLGTADCPLSGETFIVQGGVVQRVKSWSTVEKIDKGDRWTVAELAIRAPELLP